MNHKNLIINKEKNIKEGMKKIDENGFGTIIIIDDNEKVCGIITDGDIRRAILKGVDITEKIKKIMIKDFVFIYENDLNNQDIIDKAISKLIWGIPSIKLIPILDNQKK